MKSVHISGVHADHGRGGTVDMIGFLLDDGDTTILHCGDNAINFQNKPYADIVLTPIDRKYTIGPEGAAEFVRDVGAKVAIPIHYDSPRTSVTPKEFVQAMEGSGIKVVVLDSGEAYTL